LEGRINISTWCAGQPPRRMLRHPPPPPTTRARLPEPPLFLAPVAAPHKLHAHTLPRIAMRWTDGHAHCCCARTFTLTTQRACMPPALVSTPLVWWAHAACCFGYMGAVAPRRVLPCRTTLPLSAIRSSCVRQILWGGCALEHCGSLYLSGPLFISAAPLRALHAARAHTHTHGARTRARAHRHCTPPSHYHHYPTTCPHHDAHTRAPFAAHHATRWAEVTCHTHCILTTYTRLFLVVRCRCSSRASYPAPSPSTLHYVGRRRCRYRNPSSTHHYCSGLLRYAHIISVRTWRRGHRRTLFTMDAHLWRRAATAPATTSNLYNSDWFFYAERTRHFFFTGRAPPLGREADKQRRCGRQVLWFRLRQTPAGGLPTPLLYHTPTHTPPTFCRCRPSTQVPASTCGYWRYLAAKTYIFYCRTSATLPRLPP